MIYYVEDDANIRDLAVYTLSQAGFETRGFPDAEPFFAACEQQLPDVILLDIMLPGIDGLEILRRLRSHEATQHLPIMMLTAKGSEIDKVQGLELGADDYLAKPFGMMELVARVRALYRRAQAPTVTTKTPNELHCNGIDLDMDAHGARGTREAHGKGIRSSSDADRACGACLEPSAALRDGMG